jgi:hypothetical protein
VEHQFLLVCPGLSHPQGIISSCKVAHEGVDDSSHRMDLQEFRLELHLVEVAPNQGKILDHYLT